MCGRPVTGTSFQIRFRLYIKGISSGEGETIPFPVARIFYPLFPGLITHLIPEN